MVFYYKLLGYTLTISGVFLLVTGLVGLSGLIVIEGAVPRSVNFITTIAVASFLYILVGVYFLSQKEQNHKND